jgi:hypothetical protein
MTEDVETGMDRESAITRFRRRRARKIAAALVGDMTIVFADIEFDVAFSLRALTGPLQDDKLAAMEKLIFKLKLKALRETVQRLQPINKACAVEFVPLHRSAARLRERRNAFVHSRWDPETSSFLLAKPSYNVVTRQMETRCHLPVLRNELEQLWALAVALRAWRERWAG